MSIFQKLQQAGAQQMTGIYASLQHISIWIQVVTMDLNMLK